MTSSHRTFLRLWGVAVIAHLAGNWQYGDVIPRVTPVGLCLTVAGLVATALVVWPRVATMLVLSGLVVVSSILEAPVLGNHWLLAAFVGVAYIATAGEWVRFVPVAQTVLVVFYLCAAFAKLNSGFLDPATSCGLFYANQGLAEVGLAPISATSWPGSVTAWGAALVELSVVPLLLIRRTRRVGAIGAIAFHGLLSLDLAQHFYDFTAVLVPLFALFLMPEFGERFERAVNHRNVARVVAALALLVGVAVTVANVTPVKAWSAAWLTDGSFVWWVPLLILVIWAALGSASVESVSMGTPLAVVFALLVGLNGVTPYLEIKTAYGWNMYSNLVVVDGESNHFIVRRGLPLRSGHEDLVTIRGSDDSGLRAYADEGYLIPWPSFLSYTAGHPGIAVTYERGGVVHVVDDVSDDDLLRGPVPWWWRFLPLRSINGETPQECQPSFLPAL